MTSSGNSCRLNERQRFELAVLCDEHEEGCRTAPAVEFDATFVGTMVTLVKYIIAEQITPECFHHRDQEVLNPALVAAFIVAEPRRFEPGHVIYRVAIAAEVIKTTPNASGPPG